MSDRNSGSVLQGLKVGVRAMLHRRRDASLFLFTTISQGVLQGLIIWVLRDVLLHLGRAGAGTVGALLLGGFLVFGIWLLRAASTFAGQVLAVRLAYGVQTDQMVNILAKLLKLSVSFFDRNSQGDLMVSSYNDLKGVRQCTLETGNIVLHGARLIGLAVVAWLMSPKLALIGLVLVPIGLIPAQRLGSYITNAARKEREELAGIFDSFLQVSTGARVIKVNSTQGRVLDRAKDTANQLYHLVVRQAYGASLGRFLFEAVSGFGLVLVLMVGGRDVAAGTLPWQSLLSLLVAIVAVYSPMLGLIQVYSAIRTVLPNLDRVNAVLDAPIEIGDRPGARALTLAPDEITLENVSFTYGDRIVLDSVSASFRRGETIGIVGPSGTGKSTLISLLLRFYDPSGGRILLDDVDLRDVRHADFMSHCAIVLQEPFLFIDTIAENIRAGRPDASMDDVIAAAKAANIHEEIMAMQNGYDTVMGRRRDARGVSVGQKQRICIAAALLKNAPILFLDEATSNLDSVSERAVQVAIERLMEGRTTFVIAHRLSTLRDADRILVIDEGRVVGLDTHDELIESCPTYQRLWHYQSSVRQLDDLPAEMRNGAVMPSDAATVGETVEEPA